MRTVVKHGIMNPVSEFEFSVSPENAVTLCAGCVNDSRFDALTGLASRKSLNDFLNLVLSKTPGESGRIGLILIDLDRFAKINDSFGPTICDLLLNSVAQRLRSLAHAAILTARFSGDGFAIVVRDANDAWPLAERSLEVLKRSYAVGGQVIDLSVSIGIAEEHDDCRCASDLIRAANVALHRVQIAGGNAMRRFEISMLEQIRADDAVETEFREALAALRPDLILGGIRSQFEVHYQPQVSLIDGRLSGFEALVRWRNPNRGLISPDRFIPLAEQTGLIVILGDWVIDTACRDAMLWPPAQDCPEGLRLAVNVSPLQLEDGAALIASVQRALRRSGLPAERLELEVTETALTSDVSDTLKVIREMGVKLALDDFGTGYSSLSRLIHLPFNTLKIDRSFIASVDCNLTEEPQQVGEKLICAVASMGQAFGLTTVVEGIETVHQLEIARRAGCAEMQGYLISRAVPSQDVSDLIRRLDDKSTPKELLYGI